ncbi:FUSC family protein [Flavobacterium longum]|uniref:hypothetical protein n=1 Tax=Flavobacterium longum TaxID=1299340 RepID=UPI0039EA3B4D
MLENELRRLTDAELLRKRKAIKNGKLVNAVIVGFTVGIFVYSAANNGFGLFTFFPLAIGYLLVRNSKHEKTLEAEIEKELKSRNIP